jgi:hypothetical protein
MKANTNFLSNVFGSRSVDKIFLSLTPPADIERIFEPGKRISQFVNNSNNIHTHTVGRLPFQLQEKKDPLLLDTKEWVFARYYSMFLDHLNTDNYGSLELQEERAKLGSQIISMGTDVLNNQGGAINTEDSDWEKIQANKDFNSQAYINKDVDKNHQQHQFIFKVIIASLVISILFIYMK